MKNEELEEKFLELLETDIPNAKPLDADLIDRILNIKKNGELAESKRFVDKVYSENDYAFEKFGVYVEDLENISEAMFSEEVKGDQLDTLPRLNVVDKVAFNYDLDGMKRAVKSPSSPIPKFKNFDDFDKWINEEGINNE